MADEFELGQLSQAVKTLTREVSDLRREVKEITAQMNRGKGVAFGLLLAAGGLGAGISQLAGKLFGK